MAKKMLTSKNLGVLIIIALIIDHILPKIGIKLTAISLILYLFVALVLIMFS
ncbi:hypothetical protein KY334_06115 [Candidatus Woesearchaeota archaeon]|nr:hypothetical protein [Candidatus Woesearchaeota archaeon]